MTRTRPVEQDIEIYYSFVGKVDLRITARLSRHNAQVPDRNGKIFYTSITSLSHISKVPGDQAADGRRRCRSDWHPAGTVTVRIVQLREAGEEMTHGSGYLKRLKKMDEESSDRHGEVPT